MAKVASIHLSTDSQTQINTSSMLLQYSRTTVENINKNLNISGAEIKLPSLCNLNFFDSKDDCSKKTYLQQVKIVTLILKTVNNYYLNYKT